MIRRALLLAGIATLLSAPLRAAPGEVVLLLDAPGTARPKLRRQVVERLTVALQRGRSWRVQRALRPEEQLRLQLAKLLAEARAHSEQFAEALALEALARAERMFRAAFGPVVEMEPLVQVLLARARLHADTGQSSEAQAVLARVAALDPRRELDPGLFTPALVKSFAELRAAQQSGPLHIKTSPVGATVWVDGRRAGHGPLTLQLPLGEHFVAAGQPGASTGCTVRVGEESALSLGAPQPEARWRVLGQRAGATWTVAVHTSSEGTRFQARARALSTRRGEPARILSSALFDEGHLGAAVDELAARLAAQLAPLIVPPPPPPRRRTPLLRSWWFWTAVIVVVGGAATAAIVATRDRDPRVHLVLTR